MGEGTRRTDFMNDVKNRTWGLLLGLAVLTAVALLHRAQGTDFPLAQEAGTVNATVLQASTNVTGTGVFLEKSTYHTFWVVNGLTNNSVGPTNTVYLGRSLDNVNWVEWSTNSFTNANFAEVTLTGKWSWFRARVAGATTNVNVTVTYLGGR